MMQVPQQVLNLFSGFKAYLWLILLIMNIFLFWMGMWLDVIANILLFRPDYGSSGIFDRRRSDSLLDDLYHERQPRKHYSSSRHHPLCNAGSTKGKMEPLVRELLPFLIVKIIIILIVTYVPFISVWFPKLFGFATGSP